MRSRVRHVQSGRPFEAAPLSFNLNLTTFKYRTLFDVRYFFIIKSLHKGSIFTGSIYMAFFWRRNKEDKFSTSTLGLDKSIEELQKQEEAVEKEIGVRFTKAIAKTRDSINTKLDGIFEGRKQIDDRLIDELEEMLISTDIGVQTTMQLLEAIRKGVSRQEINDLAALKSVMTMY